MYVNARQHVRPKRYQRRFKKARLQLNTNDDNPVSNVLTAVTDDSSNSSVIVDQSMDLEPASGHDHKIERTSTVLSINNKHQTETSESDVQHHVYPAKSNEDGTILSQECDQKVKFPVTESNDNETETENVIHHVNLLNNNGDYQDSTSQDLDQPVDFPTTEFSESRNENDLIDFIKQQENTLLDSLLADLETGDNKNEEELDENEELTTPISTGEEKDDAPVHPGHWLTLKTSVLLIWIFAITHSLTSSQLKDLLTIINLHLLQSNPAFESLYRFKSYFSNLEMPAKKHYYCAKCYTQVELHQPYCTNPVCHKDLSKANSKEYFLELDVVSQLKTFYSRQEFEEGLKHKSTRVKRVNDNIEDIYDSEQYKKLCSNDGPLSEPYNISFTFNTDGVPIFKSSKTSVWPIFLMINELPYKMRKSRKYMILAGLWCSSVKPSMNIFLDPMCKTLSKLEKGIEVTTYSKITMLVKGFLIALSCDLPARSAVLNINQHNGEGCCIKCLQLGKNHRTQTGGNIRVFEYKQDDPTGPCRTHASIMQDAQNITNLESTSHINGIKGPSIVMFCPYVDGVKSVAIDYMHLVCLGTVRLLLKLWFNISHSLNNFSLYRYTDIVDSRLENIRPPHVISRQPRSISDHLKFWKASELRSWFLYYSVPCIADLLPPIFLYHYCSFVEGIFLLCQSSISFSDINRSEKLLQYFVFMFSSLYGEKYITINVHSLLHLPQTVRELGPLWSVSCFSFEGANGELLQLFHGTQSIDLQIVNAVHVFQMLPMMSQTISKQSIAYEFIKKLTKVQDSANLMQFSLLGKPYKKNIPDSFKLSILKLANRIQIELDFYNRAIVRGVLYQSLEYTRVSKRNSYTVKYLNKGRLGYGFVKWFAEVSDCSIQVACVIELEKKHIDLFDMHHEKLEPDEHISDNFMNLKLPHVQFLNKNGKECIVLLKNIMDLCICIEMDNFIVVCEEPNHHERNL